MERTFFLIAHNTNRIYQAAEALKVGANAIQPDIHYSASSNEFAIYHLNPIIVTPLEEYLQGLHKILLDSASSKLALIVFDLKPPYDYQLLDLFKIIRDHFLDFHPEVTVIVSGNNSDALSFLPEISGKLRDNEGIAIDESLPVSEVISTFAPLKLRYAFGSGSSVLSSLDHLPTVREALQLRGKDGLRMVYAWTVNSRENMKAFLDLEPPIDGIITDNVEELLELVTDKGYTELYRLAKPGDNPLLVRT